MRLHCWLASFAAFVIAGGFALGGDTVKDIPNKRDEPLAKKFSLEKARDSLDAMSLHWIEQRKCGSCHTTYPYLMARSALKDSAAQKDVRAFIEKRITSWDSGKKDDKPRGDTEIVATAAALAVNDAQTTGKLHPLTRQTLDRMWTLQQPDGSWDWYKCGWPPFELDDYWGAAFAAVGVGHAPEGYAETPKAKDGLKKLRDYFKNTPPPNLHHKAWLLWASLKLDGLLSTEKRQKAIEELLALQRDDGGWSLASMAEWKGQAGLVDGKNAGSDGYGTGFVVYVLRQAGVPAKDKAIQRGVAWLRSNQRESGRWFTHTMNASEHHFMSHAGTAYAVLALRACSVESDQQLRIDVEEEPEGRALQLTVNAKGEVVPQGREPLKSTAELKVYLQGYLDGLKRGLTVANKKVGPTVVLSVPAQMEYKQVHELLELCKEAGFAKRTLRALASEDANAPKP